MNRLKKLREERGMKQSELGKLLNVKDAAISKYESGKVPMTGDTLIELSKIFNVSVDYILGVDDPDFDGIETAFGYSGGDEAAVSFPHKLANQLDYNGVTINELANILCVDEKEVLDWLCGKSTSYIDYYEPLSEFFETQIRYWTSPHALSPTIEPDINEYLLILLYREYKETGEYHPTHYGSLEDYFPGIVFSENQDDKKMITSFRKLNDDNKDIIIGKIKELIKEQCYEESVTTDKLLKKTGTDCLGK